MKYCNRYYIPINGTLKRAQMRVGDSIGYVTKTNILHSVPKPIYCTHIGTSHFAGDNIGFFTKTNIVYSSLLLHIHIYV